MTGFAYKAIDANGQWVDGQIEAEDVKSALLQLEKQGYRVTSIRELDLEPDKARATFTAERGGRRPELAAIERQMTDVFAKGESIAPALEAYAEELPWGTQRRRLRRLANRLKEGRGQDLASVDFDEQWLPYIIGGVAADDPGVILSGIIDHAHRNSEIRRRFTNIVAYPLLLLFTLAALTLMFSWMIVPVFREIFADFGTELPSSTQFMIRTHDLIKNSGGMLVVGPALLIAALFVIYFGPRSWLRERIGTVIPLLGSNGRFVAAANFSRCLANLVESKVSLPDSLRISGRLAGHEYLRAEANYVASRLEEGNRDLANVHTVAIPNTLLHVLRLENQPDAAAKMLREIQWAYEQKAQQLLARWTSMLEPLFVVIVGLLIGFHFISLMMPLVSLVQNLT